MLDMVGHIDMREDVPQRLEISMGCWLWSLEQNIGEVWSMRWLSGMMLSNWARRGPWVARRVLPRGLTVNCVSTADSPLSGRFTNSHLRCASVRYSTTQTTSSSSLDCFFSFRIGKMVTLGMCSSARDKGIRLHKLH